MQETAGTRVTRPVGTFCQFGWTRAAMPSTTCSTIVLTQSRTTAAPFSLKNYIRLRFGGCINEIYCTGHVEGQCHMDTLVPSDLVPVQVVLS